LLIVVSVKVNWPGAIWTAAPSEVHDTRSVLRQTENVALLMARKESVALAGGPLETLAP
jgi:hypothetical protein